MFGGTVSGVARTAHRFHAQVEGPPEAVAVSQPHRAPVLRELPFDADLRGAPEPQTIAETQCVPVVAPRHPDMGDRDAGASLAGKRTGARMVTGGDAPRAADDLEPRPVRSNVRVPARRVVLDEGVIGADASGVRRAPPRCDEHPAEPFAFRDVCGLQAPVRGCRPYRRRRRVRDRAIAALDPHREPCTHVRHRQDMGARRRSRDLFRSRSH